MARTPVSRTDATAARLIEAALEMVDEAIGDASDLDPAQWARRQNSTLTPLFARLTASAVCQRAGTTYTTAITSRWGDIQTFVHDVLRRGLATAHSDGTTWLELAEQAAVTIATRIDDGEQPAMACIRAVDELMFFVGSSPRAMLPGHLAPYFAQLGPLGVELVQTLRSAQQFWSIGATEVVTAAGYRFREGWSAAIVVESVQSLLDGWLVNRLSAPITPPQDPAQLSPFGRAIEALILGAMDPADRWA